MDQKSSMLRKNPKAVVNKLPHGLTHAVERLSLGFDWTSPLDAQTMRKLSSLGDRIAALLPRKFEVSTSEVRASVNGIAADPLSSEDDAELYAVLFDDNEDKDAPFDIKHAEIVLKNEGLTFSVHAKYDGWEKTRAQALELYNVFFDEIADKVKLDSVQFRVSNVFCLDKFTGNLSDLLSVECDSLPRRIFNAEGLWHVDEGYFEEQIDSNESQLLVNLNVSKVLGDDGSLLYVRTMHQFYYGHESDKAISLENLFDKFTALHDTNKTLLATVLNKKISTSLGLLGDARGTI